MRIILDAFNTKKRETDLKINVDKTKVMVVRKKESEPFTLQVGGRNIERVSQFKYLGTLVNEKWNSDLEVKSRVEQARQAFLKYKQLLCDPHLAFSVGARTVKKNTYGRSYCMAWKYRQ